MGLTPRIPAVPAELVHPRADDTRAALCWTFDGPRAAISSAPVGGGSAALDWVLNIGVGHGYGRSDLEAHARAVAEEVGCAGTGAALFTAVDVGGVVRRTDGDVAVDATVGITDPTWAADTEDGHAGRDGEDRAPGTINLVVQLPVALAPAAAVNAVATATEAKTQALVEAGVPGTGTASDAVVLCWPPGPSAQPFGGPRSPWGARLARAVHAAVRDGLGDAEGGAR